MKTSWKARAPLAVFAIALLTACAGSKSAVKPAQIEVVEGPPIAPPADPAPVTDGDVTVMSIQGMQVLVKRVQNAELVAGHLYIRGGARNWTAESAGIEALAFSVAVAGGTKSLDKDAFSNRLASMGSSLMPESGEDYSVLRCKSLKQHWDASLELLAGAFLEPALPASEVELQRQRQLSRLKHELESPDGRLDVLSHQLLLKGHPQANRAIGTLETVPTLTPEALAAHLDKLRATSRLLLVVVGDVDPAHVAEQVKAQFARVPRGSYEESPYPPLELTSANVQVFQQALPTNYIEALVPLPGWAAPDFAAGMVAMGVLQDREFEEVRTRRNLSYAPAAFMSTASSQPRGGLYVTAVDPVATMEVMLGEARKLREGPVQEKDLAGSRSVRLTRYLTAVETTDGQADLLARAQLLGGDWRLARTLPDRIRAVSAADVQAFAQKYLVRLQTVVVGDEAKIDRKALLEF